jgi:DNA sulfur modification protein DndB
MNKKFLMPCLRGTFGSWITYTCSMKLKDVAELVCYAKKLHHSTRLSDMIQRELDEDRAKDISEYLKTNPDRFFSSLVVGVYGGEPTWLDIGGLRPTKGELEQVVMPEYASETVGFLSITKEEEMFALDGQHRLAGIKRAIKEKAELGEDLISVIIVAHNNSSIGLKKSRRLFTSLNKEAQPVSKQTKIALDEDDECAKATRFLVDDSNFIHSDSVSYTTGSLRDKKSFTTIGNIFDCIEKLQKYFDKSDLNKNIEEEFFNFAVKFYEMTIKANVHLSNYQKSFALDKNPNEFIKYRNGTNGGHLLFRPIGWEIYTDSFLKLLQKGISTEKAIDILNKKDLSLEGNIFFNVIWSQKSKKIVKPTAKQWNTAIKKLTETS